MRTFTFISVALAFALLLGCTSDMEAPAPAASPTRTTPAAATGAPVASPKPEGPTTTPSGPVLQPLESLGLPEVGLLYDSGDGWSLLDTTTAQSRRPGLPGAVHLAVSPDGTRIAFFHVDGQQRFLVVADLDGNARRLAEVAPLHDPTPPAWSPDGATLYVERGPVAAGADVDIVAVDAASGAVREVAATAAWEGGPQPSPDGASVLYTRAEGGHISQVWVAPAAGGVGEALTSGPYGNFAPAWIPGGGIVFLSNRTGDWELWAMDLDGSGLRNLSQSPAADVVLPVGHFSPSVSPTGEWVAFESTRDGGRTLYVAATDAGGVRRISPPDMGLAGGLPAWSPDGRFIAYSVAVDGSPEVWVTRIEGGETASLAPGSMPHWLPGAPR